MLATLATVMATAVALSWRGPDPEPAGAPEPTGRGDPGRVEPGPAPEPEPPRPASVGLLALRPGDLDATDVARYGVVVMNAWEAGRLPALRQANPGVQALVYKDMSSTRSYAARDGVDDALLPTGVGWADADRRRPDWFLTDDRGRRVEWKGYSGHWWMDVANADYIEAWTANVVAEATAAGWDGVMVDNVMTSTRHYLPRGRAIPRYPDDASYTAATDRFLAVAAPRLKAAGLAVVPNLGSEFHDVATYTQWVGRSSGAVREHYGRWGSDGNGGVLSGGDWAHQLGQQEIVQGGGGTFLAVTYARPDDVAFQRYARASFLLAWDGGRSSLVFTPPTAGRDPWTPDATVDLGLPSGPRTAVAEAWLRPYEHGVVVVNPSSTTAVMVPLGGTYAHPDAGPVTEVALPPASGLVLARSG